MTARFWLAGALALGLSASALAAGDVQITVDLTTNELRATGDGSGNEISIAEGSSLGTYTVTGLNGTTLNGAASDDFDGIRGFVINLAQGNDRVVMSPTLVRGNLRIILGEGADTVSLDGVRVHGRTAIRSAMLLAPAGASAAMRSPRWAATSGHTSSRSWLPASTSRRLPAATKRASAANTARWCETT